MRNLKIVGAVFLLGGAFILCYALFMIWSLYGPLNGRSESAMGEIVALDANGHPRVLYTAPDGAKHEIRSRFGETPPVYRVGETVAVSIDPEDYNDARLTDPREWRGLGGLTVLGLVFLCLGGVLLFVVHMFQRGLK